MIHRVPLWVKVVVPLVAAAFVSFVVISQLQQIKQLERLHVMKQTEIDELHVIRKIRDREFYDMQKSMAVRYEVFQTLADAVGVPAGTIQGIAKKDPLVKP